VTQKHRALSPREPDRFTPVDARAAKLHYWNTWR